MEKKTRSTRTGPRDGSERAQLIWEQAGRLRAARKAANFKTAAEAARHFKWIKSTYLAHEGGHQNLISSKFLIQYGRAFGVSPAWLQSGEKVAKRDQKGNVRVYLLGGNLRAGWIVDPVIYSELPSDVTEIEVPFPVPQGQFAYVVNDPELWPSFTTGTVLISGRYLLDPTPELGEYCLVKLSDGRIMLRVVSNGTEEHRYDLTSPGGQVIRNSAIEWVAPIVGTFRSKDCVVRTRPATVEDLGNSI